MSFVKRLSVPIGLAAIAALIVAFGPSLLASARSGLPHISAQQLLTNVARSKVDGLSGVVRSRSDLGLPELPSGQGAGSHSPHDHGVKPRDLATGTHMLRVASAGPQRQRIAILGDLSQYTLIHNERDVWAYDSAHNSVVHWRLPAKAKTGGQGDHVTPDHARRMATPRELAGRFLDEIGPSTEVSVTGTDQVAGRSTYTLRLAPRSADSLIGSVDIFVDARTWTPLRVTVHPRGTDQAALDVAFRRINFGEPPASRFQFTPPNGADVTQQTLGEEDTSAGHASSSEHGDHAGKGTEQNVPKVIGDGWTSVLAFDHVKAGKYGAWLARTGRHVSGDFGEGRLVTTRLFSVLVTGDGHAYIGAVTPEALQEAAAG